MDTITTRGHMIEVSWNGRVLRAHGTNKAARIALAGQDHADGDVIIPAAAITELRLVTPGLLTNGNLIVWTGEGRKYQLHYKKSQAEDFERLHTLLSPYAAHPC